MKSVQNHMFGLASALQTETHFIVEKHPAETEKSLHFQGSFILYFI